MDGNLSDFELFPIALAKAKKAIEQRANKVLKAYDLSSAHAMFLIVLLKSEGMSLKELSRHVNVDKAQTTRVIADFNSKGYIFDDKISETSRKYKVYLTETGKEIAQIMNAILSELFEEVLGVITKEEKQLFVSIFRKILIGINTQRDVEYIEEEL